MTRCWSAGPGDLIFKPRNQWHTFWNAGDEPAGSWRSSPPPGFERFFGELVDLGGVTRAEPQILADLCARYGLEMDPESVPGLVERFDLRFPGEPISALIRGASPLGLPLYVYLHSITDAVARDSLLGRTPSCSLGAASADRRSELVQ